MGWSQSDLARRLNTTAEIVRQWEMDTEIPAQACEDILEMVFKLADDSAEGIACESLAENFFSSGDLLQVDRTSIRRKFLDQ